MFTSLICSVVVSHVVFGQVPTFIEKPVDSIVTIDAVSGKAELGLRFHLANSPDQELLFALDYLKPVTGGKTKAVVTTVDPFTGVATTQDVSNSFTGHLDHGYFFVNYRGQLDPDNDGDDMVQYFCMTNNGIK